MYLKLYGLDSFDNWIDLFLSVNMWINTSIITVWLVPELMKSYTLEYRLIVP